MLELFTTNITNIGLGLGLATVCTLNLLILLVQIVLFHLILHYVLLKFF